MADDAFSIAAFAGAQVVFQRRRPGNGLEGGGGPARALAGLRPEIGVDESAGEVEDPLVAVAYLAQQPTLPSASA